MQVARELRTSAALATGDERRVADVGPADRAAALAWLPLAGLAAGAVAALGARLAAPIHELLGIGAAVAVLGALGGRGSAVAGVAVASVEAAALLGMPPAGRLVGLLVAPMLARWACVVQCYGGRATPGATGLAALAGRADFREFGLASVTALGVVLVLLDAVGLAVAVASALATLAVRVASYRRSRGLTSGAMNATSALVETSALVGLAILGRVLGGR